MKPTGTFFPGYIEAAQLMEPTYLSERFTGGHAPGLRERNISHFSSQSGGEYPLMDVIPTGLGQKCWDKPTAFFCQQHSKMKLIPLKEKMLFCPRAVSC